MATLIILILALLLGMVLGIVLGTIAIATTLVDDDKERVNYVVDGLLYIGNYFEK